VPKKIRRSIRRFRERHPVATGIAMVAGAKYGLGKYGFFRPSKLVTSKVAKYLSKGKITEEYIIPGKMFGDQMSRAAGRRLFRMHAGKLFWRNKPVRAVRGAATRTKDAVKRSSVAKGIENLKKKHGFAAKQAKRKELAKFHEKEALKHRRSGRPTKKKTTKKVTKKKTTKKKTTKKKVTKKKATRKKATKKTATPSRSGLLDIKGVN